MSYSPGSRGAVYAVRDDAGEWAVQRGAGLGRQESAEVAAVLRGLEPGEHIVRVDLEGDSRELLVIPLPAIDSGQGVIAGVASRRDDPQRDIVLAAVVRFGSVALENAMLHSRQRGKIARLQSANEDLRQVLVVHETLTADVIGAHGIQVGRRLAGGARRRRVRGRWIARRGARARAGRRRLVVGPARQLR